MMFLVSIQCFLVRCNGLPKEAGVQLSANVGESHVVHGTNTDTPNYNQPTLIRNRHGMNTHEQSTYEHVIPAHSVIIICITPL